MVMNNKKNSFTVRIAAIEQFYIVLNYIEKNHMNQQIGTCMLKSVQFYVTIKIWKFNKKFYNSMGNALILSYVHIT